MRSRFRRRPEKQEGAKPEQSADELSGEAPVENRKSSGFFGQLWRDMSSRDWLMTSRDFGKMSNKENSKPGHLQESSKDTMHNDANTVLNDNPQGIAESNHKARTEFVQRHKQKAQESKGWRGRMPSFRRQNKSARINTKKDESSEMRETSRRHLVTHNVQTVAAQNVVRTKRRARR